MLASSLSKPSGLNAMPHCSRANVSNMKYKYTRANKSTILLMSSCNIRIISFLSQKACKPSTRAQTGPNKRQDQIQQLQVVECAQCLCHLQPLPQLWWGGWGRQELRRREIVAMAYAFDSRVVTVEVVAPANALAPQVWQPACKHHFGCPAPPSPPLQCHQCIKVCIHGVCVSTARTHPPGRGGVVGWVKVPALDAGATITCR